MKKILFIAIVAISSLASCKKDYTCTCTANGSGTAEITTIKDASKKDAKKACVDYTVTGAGSAYIVKCELN